MNEKRRLTWFILIRVAVVSLFLISTIILNAKEPESVSTIALAALFKLIIATYLFSIASLVVLRFSERFQSILTYSQIIWDLLLVTLLLLFTGGINSPYSFLYTLSIINASVLLARREAIYTASLCAILYGAILDFQYFGKLAVLGLSEAPAQQHGANYILYTIFVHILAFYLTAFLTGHLAERLRKSESALQEKVIDYEELERLNSSIVSNIGSGLLTINNEGKIRVFNRYAAETTGITHEEAYDRPLLEIMSGFTPFAERIFALCRGEIEHQSTKGGMMILGFKSVPFADKEGNPVGAIIDFQDLTQLKRMEAELQKADRLAAIGELSARIAHEIRNPLASISGSVQLIAQGDRIDVADKKLLNIIIRETERLNGLIRDFLAYARPSQPVKLPVYLKQLILDISSLLETDPHFKNVIISNNCPEWLTVPVDRDQMQQVFWNLFINAAEAMPSGGVIKIDAVIVPAREYGTGSGEKVKIVVADNGAGMTLKDVQNVFEPFFTTKPEGTGLGLATVYRVIESHNGTILVESSCNSGTTFTMYLPANKSNKDISTRDYVDKDTGCR
jgi:two-component system, NtrC family, sensor histidine kinase PilS